MYVAKKTLGKLITQINFHLHRYHQSMDYYNYDHWGLHQLCTCKGWYMKIQSMVHEDSQVRERWHSKTLHSDCS